MTRKVNKLCHHVGLVPLFVLVDSDLAADLHLRLHPVFVAFALGPQEDRAFGHLLEVCSNRRKTEPLCGLVLCRNGLPLPVYKRLISA